MSAENDNKLANNGNENFFSGIVRLGTPEGPVVVKLVEAQVFAGMGIMVRSRVLPEGSRLFEANSRLEGFINDLPQAVNPNSKERKGYLKERATDILQYGTESLLSIFPAYTDRDISFLVRIYKSLKRGGINTKTDLLKASGEKLASLRNTGDKAIYLMGIMREIALGEREMKLQENNQD